MTAPGKRKRGGQKGPYEPKGLRRIVYSTLRRYLGLLVQTRNTEQEQLRVAGLMEIIRNPRLTHVSHNNRINRSRHAPESASQGYQTESVEGSS